MRLKNAVYNRLFVCLENGALAAFLSLFLAAQARAAEAELRPGDTIGPHNWERVKEMVGENLLSRIKQGYTFKIKAPTRYQPPREYVEATKKHAPAVRLGPDGELLNHVAGLPFPQIDPRDPQAGQKVAWNFYWRWQGDDFKGGGGTETGKMIRYAIEKDGSERRYDFYSYFLFPRTRVLLLLFSLSAHPRHAGAQAGDSRLRKYRQHPASSGLLSAGQRGGDHSGNPLQRAEETG